MQPSKRLTQNHPIVHVSNISQRGLRLQLQKKNKTKFQFIAFFEWNLRKPYKYKNDDHREKKINKWNWKIRISQDFIQNITRKKNFFFLKIKLRMGNDCIQPFAQFSNTAFSTSFSRIFIGWVTALSLGKQLDQTIGTT